MNKGQWDSTPWRGSFFTGEAAFWSKDSHILLGEPPHSSAPPGDPQTYGVLVAVGTGEDNDTSGFSGSGNYEYAMGTYLANTAGTGSMAFAVGSAWQQADTALAQIVLDGSAPVILTGTAVAVDGSYIRLNVEIIPEPAALALLAMGAAGVLAKLKKKRRQ